MGRRAVAVLSVLMLVSTMGPVVVAPAAGAAPGRAGEDPRTVALDHIAEHRDAYGLSLADLDELEVAATVPALRGANVVYLQQRHDGLDVFNAITDVVVGLDGTVLTVGSRFVGGMAKAPAPNPKLSDVAAVQQAAQALGLQPSATFRSSSESVGAEQSHAVTDGGISREAIPVRLVYQPLDDGSVELAWEVRIAPIHAPDVWQLRIDGATGEELDRNDLVADERPDASADLGVGGGTYRVFDGPLESPTFGSRTLVADPADGTASPYGWHDTNGVAGAESTKTIGNNVTAYTDVDNNNIPDALSQPDGGAGLAFDFPLDLSGTPSTYRPAAVTNLFYWNNHIHDVFYAYGFDEASGNFQTNNYGHGGTGGDAVLAEAQDGGGTNNANFYTPSDGSAPRMQMYDWSYTTPGRDGDLDNGVVAHEYGHGISNRLTGGPANVSCLSNNEQAGEGWSDWFALMLTMDAGDAGTDRRGIATYLLGQPTTGTGIRAYPYSTDLSIDPRTYDSIKTAAIPHGVGSVWAAMLWELTWGLVAENGWSADLIGGTSGNNIALQLVVDGLKVQPCSPGFVDSRNAILAADQSDYGGQHQCLIWTAFAKRGLGYSANQGSSASTADGTQAFDVPPSCVELELNATGTPDPVPAGSEITLRVTATNNSPTDITGVQIADPVPANTTYVPSSATCGGTLVSGAVQFAAGTLLPGASRTCSFRAVVDASPYSALLFADGFDAGTADWSTTHGAGTTDFAVSTTTPYSAPNSMFATDPAVVSDQYLATVADRAYTGGEVLRFQHSYSFEPGYDGGVVEASTDGGVTWFDVGSAAIDNGYDQPISTAYGNPIAGRSAFTGSSGGYIRTVIDLDGLAGSTARLRFRAASDTSVSAAGWHVDDVEIARLVTVVNAASATDDQGHSAAADSETTVSAPQPVIHPGVATVLEGDSGSQVVNVPVTLSNPSATPVTVQWTTVDTGAAGIATAGADYVAASGTVTFAPGETTASVPITVLGDVIDEPPAYLGEWGLVSFSNPSANATLDTSFYGLGIFIIVDNDPQPVIHPGVATVLEGDSGSQVVNVPVTLSNPSATPVTVQWTTVDTGAAGIATAGADYVAASGTVTFAPGETTASVPITVLGDVIDEPPVVPG